MRAKKILLALFLAWAPASAVFAQVNPADIGRTNLLAFGAWQRIVPAEYHNLSWIVSLEGAGAPFDRVILREKPFFLGKVCMPRECGGNEVAFLIAVDGSEAYGLLDSRALGVGRRFFGLTDGDARRLLANIIR